MSMADDVTKLGGSWQAMPVGSAERALGNIIASGKFTGTQVEQEIDRIGFKDRGPKYYPREDGKGPFYALGNPHNYASLETDNNDTRWEIILNSRIDEIPVKNPPPEWSNGKSGGGDSGGVLTRAELDAALQRLVEQTDRVEGELSDRLNRVSDSIAFLVNTRADQTDQRIADAVKNEQTSFRSIAAVLGKVIPELADLFNKSTPPAKAN
jgi:hypothetical protein